MKDKYINVVFILASIFIIAYTAYVIYDDYSKKEICELADGTYFNSNMCIKNEYLIDLKLYYTR